MVPRSLVGPGLQRVTCDLDGASTGAAHEVMVVIIGGAAPVDGLSFVVSEDIDGSALCERLQRPVDGCEPHSLARGAHQIVDLLSSEKRVGGAEGVHDGDALWRRAERRFKGCVGNGSLLYSTVSSAAMTPTPASSAPTCSRDFAGSGSLCNSGMRSVLAM